jgi:putative ABC transport system permease protein
MIPAATIRAAWRGVTGRPLQATIIALVALVSTAASALALGMAVEANAPFDHAFARDHGAHVSIVVDTARAAPSRLAATTRLRGVTAAAGPFPLTEVSARITLAGATGALNQQVVLTGRPAPGGPVDDLALDAGRWADRTGEVVWARSRTSLPVTVGQQITVRSATGSPQLTVVGIATSVTGTAQAWVTPAEIAALRGAGQHGAGQYGAGHHGPGAAQMLYRFASAGTTAAISADVSAIRAALPRGALLGTPQSYLTVQQQAAAQIAPFVPFIVVFGVIALMMSVLIVVNVVSGAVVAGTRRIGVLKSIGFTPSAVVGAYVLQVALPAAAGCAAGAVLGDLLSVPLLSLNASVYGVGILLIPAWVVVAVPAAMLALTCGAALVPGLRAGRMSTVRAIATGRAPRAAHGYTAHRLLGRLPALPRTLTIGLAAPFARPARTSMTLAAVVFGAAAVIFGIGLGTSASRAAAELSGSRTQPVQISPPAGALTAGQQRAIISALVAEPGTAHYTAETDDQVASPGLSSPLSVTSYAGNAEWTGWSLITGRWYSRGGQADVNTDFLTVTGTRVGDIYPLTAGGRQVAVRIVGEVFDTQGHGADIFMSSATLSDLAPGLPADQYDVGLRPGTNAQSYANAVSARLGPSLDVSTIASSPVFAAVLVLVAVLTVLLMAVAGLGVLNTAVLQIRERAHDLGVFKAIGMTPRQTLAMVVCSAAGIGAVGGAIAVPLGVALHRFLLPVMGHAGQTNVPGTLLSVYSTTELVLLGLAGLLISVGGALGPASWIARTRTATTLRAE